MANNIELLNQHMTSLGDEVRRLSGQTGKLGVEAMATALQGVTAGGGDVAGGSATDDVVFYDYDGLVLHSYSLEEIQVLTELPPLPEHKGLICQGWNWTLEAIKQHNRKVNVGAMYITDDGHTRVYITLQEGRTSPMLGVCPKGTVTVDWGDGTTPDVLTGASTTSVRWTPTHEYSEAGDYVINLIVDGEIGFYGSSSNNQYAAILRYSSDADTRNYVYRNSVKKVECGSGVTSIGSYAFHNCHSLASITIPDNVNSIGGSAFGFCYSLASITIPENVTFIGTYAFYNCYSLASITIPDNVNSIGGNAFGFCYSLASITIPDNVNSIGGSAFGSCYSLASITIPEGVTSIGSYAFGSCYGMRYYDFTKRTSIPTLSATTVFYNIPSDCEFLVPSALYDEWIAATNWSTYADKIIAR